MKKYIWYYLIVLFLPINAGNYGNNQSNTTTESITAMTYNIKYDNKSDNPTGWDQRKEQVTDLINFYEPDFLGTQEGLVHQLKYMKTQLNSMRWIGVGRTDGKSEGEFSAIFYNARRFKLVENSDSTIWFSKNPAEPSKNWDAALPRIISWGEFIDKQHGNEFFVFNTHFDHIGDTARIESAKIIKGTIKKIAKDAPVILMGDFNVTPDATPYAVITSENGLMDSHKQAGAHIGPEFTFSGFKVNPEIEKRRIDYIFLSDGISVTKHGAISDFSGGYYPSDHLPVISKIKLPPN